MSPLHSKFSLVATLDLALSLEWGDVRERYLRLARILGAWRQPEGAMFFVRMAQLEEDEAAQRPAGPSSFVEPGNDDRALRQTLRAALDLAARADHCARVFFLLAREAVHGAQLRALFSQLAEDALAPYG